MQTTQAFGTSLDYHELNSAPHRNQDSKFHAPLLSRHLCFWTSQPVEGPLTRDRRHKVNNEVDRFVTDLFQHLNELNNRENISELAVSSVIRNRLILFNNVLDFPECNDPQNYWDLYDGRGNPTAENDLDPRQRDVFESLFRAINISFRWRRSVVNVRIELDTEYLQISFFAELSKNNDKIQELRKLVGLRRSAADGSSDQEDVDASIKKVRDHLYDTFWSNFRTEFLECDPIARLHNSEGKDTVFSGVFADFRGLVLSEDEAAFGKPERDHWGNEAVDSFMPVLASRDKYQCAANYLLEGRAMYMSTLGPQIPSHPVANRIPVNYLIYCREYVNKWELGRLVLSINALGCVRLASLRQLKKLVEAGHVLARLEPIVKDARSKITEESPILASRLIKSANETFNEINDIEKTILYRIERSRSYKNQFDGLISQIGIKPIHGYHAYNDFVRRRLGAALDFVNHLGVRYERATSNLSLLQQYHLSITANSYARAGEALLVIVLLPYYITSLLFGLAGKDSAVIAYSLSLIAMTIGSVRLFRPYAFLNRHGSLSKRIGWLVYRSALTAIPPLILIALPLAVEGKRKTDCFTSPSLSSISCYCKAGSNNQH